MGSDRILQKRQTGQPEHKQLDVYSRRRLHEDSSRGQHRIERHLGHGIRHGDPATLYDNGIISDLEGLAIKRFKNGFGIGFVGSWIQQVTDDGGKAAQALNGFVGRAFGIGPIVTYSTKLGKSHLDFSARWIHDFDVTTASRVTGSTSRQLKILISAREYV